MLCDLIKRGGSGCLVTEMHGMPPSRLRGCVQANYQQLIPNLQIAYCIIRLPHAKVTTNSVNKLSTQFKAPYTSSNCKKLDVISKPLTFAGTSAFWGVLWGPGANSAPTLAGTSEGR
jgi:hypothetical protein